MNTNEKLKPGLVIFLIGQLGENSVKNTFECCVSVRNHGLVTRLRRAFEANTQMSIQQTPGIFRRWPTPQNALTYMCYLASSCFSQQNLMKTNNDILDWRNKMNNLIWKVVKSRVAKMLYVLVGLITIWYWRAPLLEVLALIGDREVIVVYVQQYGAWGPILLSVMLMAQVFLAVIPGHAIIVAGGYIYGLIIGSIITQISTVFASQLAFLLARRIGYPLVNRFAPAQVIDRWNELAEKQGGVFFFFAFILPIFPNDLMSFIAGLSSISPKRFFIANFFGRLPCAIFITLIGSHGIEMPLQYWAVIVIIVLGLCISWKQISSYLEQRFPNNPQPANCLFEPHINSMSSK